MKKATRQDRALAGEATISLSVRKRGTLLRVLALGPGLYTLGSDSTCDIRLSAGPEVALEHAFIRVEEGEVFVQRAVHAPPLTVNGIRFQLQAVMHPGDKLRCGAFELEFSPLLFGHAVPPPLPPAKLPALDDVTSISLESSTDKTVIEAFPGPPKPVASRPAPRTKAKPAPRRNTPVPRRVTLPVIRAQPPKPPPLPQQPPRAPKPPQAEGGSEPLLFAEVFWGGTRIQTHSFSARQGPVLAEACDGAQLPLWGFDLPAGPYPLAFQDEEGFLISPPKNAAILEQVRGHFRRRLPSPEPFVLRLGEKLRLRNGTMTLELSVALAPPRPPLEFWKSLPRLPLALCAGLLSLLALFIALAPSQAELDSRPVETPPVAVRLIQPPKKEEKKKEKKKEPPARADKTPAHASRTPSRSNAHPVGRKALQSLARLTSAGPAASHLLTSARVKAGPAGLAGLVGSGVSLGKGAGLAFSQQGMGGAELLGGKGGRGIGAMGAKGYGTGGEVGATVGQAVARKGAPQGNVDREAVAKAVRSHLDEVRACYERALLSTPGLAGKLLVEWVIDTRGRVVSARSKSSTLSGGGVEGCVLGRLKTWDFPAAEGGQVIVSYPFLFNAVGN